MNNKFILNANGTKKEAEFIIKFNLENRDYLIYCTEENENNKQVFVSKLTLNTEGKYFVDDITTEEKNKLNGVVYNIVILTPNEAKKGLDAKSLIDKLTMDNKLTLSVEMPLLNEQTYYSNCSIAITSKQLVEEAINFFKTNLTPKVEVPVQEVPTWSIPTMEINSTPVQEPVAVAPTIEPVVSTPNVVSTEPTPVVNPTIQVEPKPVADTNSSVSMGMPAGEVNNIPVSPSPMGVNNGVEQPLPNPQAEKLAVVSDPSLTNAGLNLQPNVGKMNNAGNANTKYIIIGTICLVLAIAVVIIAYFLIKDMK